MRTSVINVVSRILLVCGVLSLIIGAGDVTGKLNSSSQTNALLGFDSSYIGDWKMSIYGNSNYATLTTAVEGGNYYSKFTCTAYNDPDGWVAQVYWFDSLEVGKTYTVSFGYRSTTLCNAQFISDDASLQEVQHVFTSCPTSANWVHKSFNVTVQQATFYRLSFNLYTKGEFDLDEVNFKLDVAPTPTPTASIIPIPTTKPTSTATSTYTGENYAPMFQFGTSQSDGCTWGDYDVTGTVHYGASNNPQICFRDDSVTYNGHSSIRLTAPNNYNPYREVNNDWIAVHPNDHVVFTCLVKTASGTGNAGIIGFDAYGSSSRILEVHTCTPQTAIWNMKNGVPVQGGISTYIPYSSDWTRLTLDVVIPSTTYSYNDFSQSIPTQQISGIIPWVGGGWNGQSSYPNIWFVDAELFINL